MSYHGDNAQEFKFTVAAGMSPMEAIRTATIHAADLLGEANRLGSLKAGMFADVIAVKGNPLEDISLLENVAFVMKDGVVVKTP